MPSSSQPLPSNIRAYVHWKNSVVYAGEDIECIITFKNTARLPKNEGEDNERQALGRNGALHSRKASANPSAMHSRRSSLAQMKPPPFSRAPSLSATSARGTQGSRGHRPSLSLNVVTAPSRAVNGLASGANTPNGTAKPTSGHARSLSIISLGSEAASEGRMPIATAPGQNKRPSRGHGRSASMQYTSSLGGHSPATTSMLSPRQPSPLYEATTPPEAIGSAGHPVPVRPARRKPGIASAGNTPQLGRMSSLRKQSSTEAQDIEFKSFRFPFEPATSDKTQIESEQTVRPKLGRNPSTMHSSKRQISPRPPEGWTAGASSLNPISRVMSETSQEETPRSSSEFYSLDNNSDETLASELPSQQGLGRLLPKPPHSRQPSKTPQTRPAEPETLMMAFVQTMGHFTLDGSLVNAAPFEDVKRRGAQTGGGVVGVERSKRSSGLFGALGWGNIGESLGSLLGGDEMSSMAQMKANTGSKTIPLLSTPQSLLFVDLRLAPGESSNYSYRFSLPRGLPPSHKGRAIKVTYHLSLGVQRPEGQVLRHVEVPFRVLGSYDSRGDMLGHDLMSPYVLLRDAAQTMSLSSNAAVNTAGVPKFLSETASKNRKTPAQGLEDFLRYTERLLETPLDANGVLLSPTSPVSPPALTPSRQSSGIDQGPENVKEAIDFAILRSNHVQGAESGSQGGGTQSTNRFNIARSGQPVAVLTILRPAYRLGEAVTGTVDFTSPDIVSETPGQAATYSVLLELESSEHVDPSLALRSGSSINRVTRRVHALARANSIFAKQNSFNLVIPSNAAPSFETTGVSLNWRLRIEFTTQRHTQGLGIQGSNDTSSELLEELGSDERGTTMIAKERLLADTFEIAVPLKVYGAVGIDTTDTQELFV